MRRSLKLALPVSALLLSACVVAPYHARGYGGYDGTDVVVDVAPPRPYVEVRPALPFPGAIWIGGYWDWSGGRHRWIHGHYERPRHGYRWEPRRWEHRGGRWHGRGGNWRHHR